MKESKPKQASVLQGERGIPSVNEKNAASSKNSLALMVLVMGVLLSLLFGFLSYQWSNREKKNNEPQQAASDVASSVPAKTFSLPKEGQNKHLLNQAPHQLSRSSLQGIQSLDKNASSLMIAQASNRSHEKTNGHESDLTGQGVVNTLLYPSEAKTHKATILRNRSYLLPKGRFINCGMQTEFISAVGGFASCRVTKDIYSEDGKVVLIERGSMISGEYRSTLKQGQKFIFVLWTQVRTPYGVVANLDSPATSPLGSSGLSGYVDNHFVERFGSAILFSFIQDASSASTKSFQHKGETIQINHTSDGAQSMATEALRHSIHIPPTLYKNHGDEAGVYIARDIDFRGVYGLKPE